MTILFLFYSGKVRWSTGSLSLLPSFLFDVRAIAHSLGSPFLPSCSPDCLPSVLPPSTRAACIRCRNWLNIYFIEAQFSELPAPRPPLAAILTLDVAWSTDKCLSLCPSAGGYPRLLACPTMVCGKSKCNARAPPSNNNHRSC